MKPDLKTISVVLAVLINVGAFLPYLRDIFLKKTKPHAYTWLIWFLTQGTAAAGIWYGSGGLGAIALVTGVFFGGIVFLASLKLGTRNITRSDTVVLIAAILAILVWWQLNNPLLAILMVSTIDVLGYIPTWRKSITEPWSETLWSWTAFSIANVFAILALTEYNLLTVSYLAAITVANMILVVICLFFRRRIPRPTL